MKAVTVENLSFRYQATGEDVLKNISFEIVQGEIVFLMGLSG